MRSSWGAPMTNPPSRFLSELPAEVVDVRGEGATSQGRVTVTQSMPSRKSVGESSGEVLALDPGDRVLHPTFGLGTVVTTRGTGDRAEASIDFGSAGTKRLLLRYAPVEKLGAG